MRISDWSSDVCSSDLRVQPGLGLLQGHGRGRDRAEPPARCGLAAPELAAPCLEGERSAPRPTVPRRLRLLRRGDRGTAAAGRAFSSQLPALQGRSEERRGGEEGDSKSKHRGVECTEKKK